MGHGDDLVICDTNFPADSVALVHGGVDVRRTMPGSRLSASLIWRAFAAALLRWPDVDPWRPVYRQISPVCSNGPASACCALVS